MDRPVGIIVAGGRATRLGGGDKTLRLLGGRAVLAWLIDRVTPQCAALALNANGEAGRFAAFGLPVVPDHDDDLDRGPLAGVLAGLAWAAARHPSAETLLTVPADVPWPPLDLVTRLMVARRPPVLSAAAARSGGRSHPLAALWPIGRRDEVARAVRQEGEQRVGAVLGRLGVAWVDWPTVPVDPFTNINTPEDLRAAALRISASASGFDGP